MQKLLTRKTLGRGNGYIVQSSQDEQELLEMLPNAVYKKTVHPTYNAFKLTDISKLDARKKLGLPENLKVLLFFGFVREYKGLKHLLNAMPLIVNKIPDCKLMIVGDIMESEKANYLQRIERTGCKDSIMLVSDYVPDREVENYFSSCDLVVMPYESATQSGIAQIAYGFNKPVVATDVGGLPEVVLDNKTGYIVPPYQHELLADAVIKFFSENKAESFKEFIESEAFRFSWERMTEIVEELEEMIP
jgi:glycosyltransferase involved in cell wall biosynthesis